MSQQYCSANDDVNYYSDDDTDTDIVIETEDDEEYNDDEEYDEDEYDEDEGDDDDDEYDVNGCRLSDDDKAENARNGVDSYGNDL